MEVYLPKPSTAILKIAPHITEVQRPTNKKAKMLTGTFSFRHFNLGILAIFLYMGVEVGVPNFVQQYLVAAPTDATPGLGIGIKM